MRAETGLARAEVAAFRQAWENSRYQDVIAEKTRLQTELDLLRTQQGTQAAMAPVVAEVQALKNQFASFFNSYNAKAASATAGA